MKRLKVYLDTYVVSYLYQEDAPEKIKVVTTLEGYKDLLIYPPSILLEEGDDDE